MHVCMSLSSVTKNSLPNIQEKLLKIPTCPALHHTLVSILASLL